MIDLEPLTEQHQDVLWDMLYLALFVPPGASPLPREGIFQEPLSRYADAWGRAGDLGLLARDPQTGEAVGAVWLRHFPAEAPGYGFVAEEVPELSIAVVPRFRGQGTGTRLLEAVLDVSDARGVSLSVSRKNPAVRLYRRFGFQEVAGDGNTVIMERTAS